MRKYIAITALTAAGLVAAGGPADAQYRYGSPPRAVSKYRVPYGYPGGAYTPYSPLAAGGWGQAYTPGVYEYQPTYSNGSVYGGYPAAGQFQPVDPAASGVVRSLYLQYLGREPDPEGLQFWSNRLAALGGDTGLLTLQFAAAAQPERAGYTPGYYNPSFRSYYGFR